MPTHDATNAFRAYRRDVLKSIPIESDGGFEYTLEITAKAYAAGPKITEVPSTWRDRTAGDRPDSASGRGCRAISAGTATP